MAPLSGSVAATLSRQSYNLVASRNYFGALRPISVAIFVPEQLRDDAKHSKGKSLHPEGAFVHWSEK